MAVEALGHAPRPPGVLTRLGASLLDGLQVLGEATRLFFATVRAAAFVPADRQRVVLQMVRVGTDTLLIGALLSLFVGMTMVVQAADQVREVSQDILGPIVGLAMTKELGPVLMAFLLAGSGVPGSYLFVALLALVGIGTVAVLGTETKGRTIEHV